MKIKPLGRGRAPAPKKASSSTPYSDAAAKAAVPPADNFPPQPKVEEPEPSTPDPVTPAAPATVAKATAAPTETPAPEKAVETVPMPPPPKKPMSFMESIRNVPRAGKIAGGVAVLGAIGVLIWKRDSL
jgi:hypothetical protein